MKASDLELQEFVNFQDGNIDLQGRRLVLHSLHAFGHFRKDILDLIGTERARRIFTRYGSFWGRANGLAMRRSFKWENNEEEIRAGFRMMMLEGTAKVNIKHLKVDRVNGVFEAEIELYDSAEAEEHLMDTGWSDEPICWKLIGYASGYVSYCFGKKVLFVEKKCRATGDYSCYIVGKDIDSWGDEIKNELKYYEEEDIKGTVDRLSTELAAHIIDIEKKKDDQITERRNTDPFFLDFRSKSLQAVLYMADRVAKFDSSVLLTGESGVGKEILARYIHRKSNRIKENFITVNCSALPETLLESELFGHKAGSFTGAVKDRKGLFEEAENGTVFLDEIGDISQTIQLKLLRVLQEKEIVRVGENIPRKVDVRILAATNKNLDQMVSEERFREDLLYRLKVIEIEIPPLRDRVEDILPLARHITDRLSSRLNIQGLKLNAKCINYFQAYLWPGNVRELENALERAAVFSEDGIIHPENLPQRIIKEGESTAKQVEGGNISMAQMERSHIVSVLKSTSGNRTHAAKILNISPSTLWRKMKEYEIS